jgi:hypothetical protein
MSVRLKYFAVLFAIVVLSALAAAADDTITETPNDPAVNVHANACYTGGSMEAKCDWPTEEETEWAWTCGWYVIRVEAGMFPVSALPAFCLALFATVDAGACAVDDVYENDPGQEGFVVDAPGVLANDLCDTSVVSYTEPVVQQGGNIDTFTLNPDGSFDYAVTDPDTIFTFTYTVGDGSTATVTVYHDIGLGVRD